MKKSFKRVLNFLQEGKTICYEDRDKTAIVYDQEFCSLDVSAPCSLIRLTIIKQMLDADLLLLEKCHGWTIVKRKIK